MARRGGTRIAENERGAEGAASNPLAEAVAARDARALDMVAEAVRHRNVLLAFQPVVTAADQSRTAFWEGLVRVLDETGRVIPAKDFIAAVEETETGRELDCLALERGLRTLAQQPELRLSINMSARSIGYRRWTRTLERGLTRDRGIAERLILEIAEAGAMLMPEVVIAFMGAMQRRGVSFALDGFGSGSIVLRHFRAFTFDILKIDGQYVRDIHRDADNQVLTRGIVELARQLDMFTVAERVEQAADARVLAEIGVDCLQGHFFAAPTAQPPWAARKGTRRAG
ncbi:EAL domain-containing protein [Rhodosalinus sp. K401]|uniref:EAL domain-containing protein n=1 Tax=Rhodosalinus sp. K401 TaxID=3239195 RepID=UPI003525D3DD